jgi:prevent-host-death family protein
MEASRRSARIPRMEQLDGFRRVPVSAAEEAFADLVSEVNDPDGAPVVLTVHRRDKAALVSIDDYRLIEEAKRLLAGWRSAVASQEPRA